MRNSCSFRKGLALCLIAVFMLLGCAGCASLERWSKDVESDLSGGLERTVTVYTANGDVLKTYEGKIDLESTEGGIVKFDLNGQRIMYYNCYVEVIEKVDGGK